jgi:hypothetical protein
MLDDINLIHGFISKISSIKPIIENKIANTTKSRIWFDIKKFINKMYIHVIKNITPPNIGVFVLWIFLKLSGWSIKLNLEHINCLFLMINKTIKNIIILLKDTE